MHDTEYTDLAIVITVQEVSFFIQYTCYSESDKLAIYLLMSFFVKSENEKTQHQEIQKC